MGNKTHEEENTTCNITVTDAVDGPGLGMTTRTEEDRKSRLLEYMDERNAKLRKKCTPVEAPEKCIEFPVDVNLVLEKGLSIQDGDVLEVGWPDKNGRKTYTKLRYEGSKFWTSDSAFLKEHGTAPAIDLKNLRKSLEAQVNRLKDLHLSTIEAISIEKDPRMDDTLRMVDALRKMVTDRISQVTELRDEHSNMKSQLRNLRNRTNSFNERLAKVEVDSEDSFERGLKVLKRAEKESNLDPLQPTPPVGKIPDSLGEFSLPSTPPRVGDSLVFDGKNWVCSEPKALAKPKPIPQVWLGPRMALGLALFSPAMLLGPVAVMAARLTLAATVPSQAHKVPGFRKTVRGFARFVFKDDMNWRHLVFLGPASGAAYQAFTWVAPYLASLPW